MTYGAAKYGRHNWRQQEGDTEVSREERLIAAAGRHINGRAIEGNTDESGLPHLAHAIASLMMALEFELEGENKKPHRVIDYIYEPLTPKIQGNHLTP